MAWAKSTSKTLSSAAADIQTDTFTSAKIQMIMCHILENSGAQNHRWQLGNSTIDTGTNYASRRSIDGGTDITATSQNYVWFAADTDSFSVGYFINIAAEEKLMLGFHVNNGTTGAGTAPSRQEWNGKWDDTSNQFDIMEAEAGSGTTVLADSNLSVLGTN